MIWLSRIWYYIKPYIPFIMGIVVGLLISIPLVRAYLSNLTCPYCKKKFSVDDEFGMPKL